MTSAQIISVNHFSVIAPGVRHYLNWIITKQPFLFPNLDIGNCVMEGALTNVWPEIQALLHVSNLSVHSNLQNTRILNSKKPICLIGLSKTDGSKM